MPIITYPITDHPLDGGACYLCRARDDGIGAYIDRDRGQKARIAFTCNEHVGTVTKALRMREKFDYHDDAATLEGLFSAGEFLDKIGQTDFAQMSRGQMIQFFKAFRDGHKKELDRRLREHEAPF